MPKSLQPDRPKKRAGGKPGPRRPTLSEKQELFCVLVSTGVGPDEAFLEAGYILGAGNNLPSQVKRHARLLMEKPHIAERIEELIRAARGAVEAHDQGVPPALTDPVAVGAVRVVLDAIERQAWTRQALMLLISKATNEGQYDSALDGLRMLGTDAGMWPEQVAEGQRTPLPGRTRSAAQREAAAMGAAAAGAVTAGIVAGSDILDKLRQARGGGSRKSAPVLDGHAVHRPD